MIHHSLVQSAIKVYFLKYIFFRFYKPTKFRFYKLFTTVLPCYRHSIWIKAPSDLCITFIPYVHNRSIDHTCSVVLLHCFKIRKVPFKHQQLPVSVRIWANVWKTGKNWEHLWQCQGSLWTLTPQIHKRRTLKQAHTEWSR